jgi:L-threonylcarbamoyladenylate synthase
MEDTIKQGITVLLQGGIVIYPTDTAFGIGCRIDNESTIKRLFTIRRRPENQATPVLVGGIEMATKYLRKIPQKVETKLMRQYWPGALTIVLPSKTDNVPSLVRGGTEKLGVRMPNHSITLELIRGIDMPLLGPSANFHNEQTPYLFSDLNEELIKSVDYVIPGVCLLKQASTVIDCSDKQWRIIRQGVVKLNLH